MQAVTITVGKHYGAKDMHQIPKVFRAAWQMAFGVGVLTTLMFLLIPETLFSIFVPEKESILMGRDYLYILAASQLFMCMEMVSAATFHGVGKSTRQSFHPFIMNVGVAQIEIMHGNRPM